MACPALLLLLPLMCTPQLPAVDRIDAPVGAKGLIHFAERRSLVSARVPAHFKWPVQPFNLMSPRVPSAMTQILPYFSHLMSGLYCKEATTVAFPIAVKIVLIWQLIYVGDFFFSFHGADVEDCGFSGMPCSVAGDLTCWHFGNT